MPLGQASGFSRADPGGRVTPRFCSSLTPFRQFIDGSLALASLNHTRRDILPTLTATLTTIALDDRSLQRLEARTSLPASNDLPSSLVQLRIAVWTGDTRDTRPQAVISRIEIPQRKQGPV